MLIDFLSSAFKNGTALEYDEYYNDRSYSYTEKVDRERKNIKHKITMI